MSFTYQYPHPALTADMVVFHKNSEDKWRVLLIRRGNEPYKGCWAFPGGFMNIDETTATCARRELLEETGLIVNDIAPIGVYDKVDRDPRERVVTVAYLAVASNVEVAAGDDAAKAQWFSVDELPPLAFDHEQIFRDAYRLLFSSALR